jgi:hypothetical protein
MLPYSITKYTLNVNKRIFPGRAKPRALRAGVGALRQFGDARPRYHLQVFLPQTNPLAAYISEFLSKKGRFWMEANNIYYLIVSLSSEIKKNFTTINF